jgi:hypothetical protein
MAAAETTLTHLTRAWHSGWVACAVTDRVNDDLSLGRFVKNEVWVRRGVQAANNWIGCADPDMRMDREKVDDRLDARLNAFGALRRCAAI